MKTNLPMLKIDVRDRLPEDRTYVLAHHNRGTWEDDDDPDGNRYWVVLKFKRGISLFEREKLPDDHKLKKTYRAEDEWGNNEHPFCWKGFGSRNCFDGQEIDFWCELPKCEFKKYGWKNPDWLNEMNDRVGRLAMLDAQKETDSLILNKILDLVDEETRKATAEMDKAFQKELGF